MKKLIEIQTKLKPNPEKFCCLYAESGNAVRSYAEAYGFDILDRAQYMTAAAGSNRALKNTKILKRIGEILNHSGFNDECVDNQLNFLIRQQTDLKTKLGAIREYNVLKNRTKSSKSVFANNTFNLTQLVDKATALNSESESAGEKDII
jgi:hypothetical protein